MSKDKETRDEEERFYMEYKSKLNRQNNIKKKYDYLKKVDERFFTSKYVYAQAQEICTYINNLRHTPFRSWEAFLKVDLETLCDQFYIKENEYGELEPDSERIDTLILPEPYNEQKERFGIM